MASIIHPKTGPDGEVLSWDPNQIPSTKPFINIVTSPAGPLTAQDDTNFIKTKSLIYTVFHQNARYVNFEVGYSKDAKWFEFLSDKWNDYASFYIGGFLEAIYSIPEKDTSVIYVQVDAKSIDYDVRFRTTNFSQNQVSPTSSPKSAINAFARRRAKSSNSPTTPKSTVAIQELSDDDSENGKLTRFRRGKNSLKKNSISFSS